MLVMPCRFEQGKEENMGSLGENWLANEFQVIDDEIEGWSDGLKESFQSLFADPNEEATGLVASSPSNSD